MSSTYQKRRELLQKEIKSLRRQDGSYHPEDVISWAKSHPSSLLHKSFNWDDRGAANEFRLIQARGLLERYIVVEMIKKKPVESQLISITSRRGSDEGSYLPVTIVAADKALRLEAFEQAIQQLKGIKNRYGWLKELKVIWDSIPE